MTQSIKIGFIATILLMLAMTTAYSQNQKIRVPGFGDIPATKNGDQYPVTFADYGTFDFTGSLNPLGLESKITVDQLKNFPGYNIFKNLDLRDIIVSLSPDGFEMEARAGAVDVKGSKVRSNGAPLHLWDPHGGDSQKFAMMPTSRNTFVLFSKGYKAVDVKGGDIHDNGSTLQALMR